VAHAAHILVLPILFEGQVKGRHGAFVRRTFNPRTRRFLDQLTESIGIVLTRLKSNTRTEIY